MARIRTIKPETSEDEKLGQVSRDARLMFILLWTICDDHGRFRAAPVHLRSRLFGYDDVSLTEVADWLGELAGIGRVRLYEVDGERYGVVANWTKHQRIDNASKPLYPEPPTVGDVPPPTSPRGVSANGESPELATTDDEAPQSAENLGESPQPSAVVGGSPLDPEGDQEQEGKGEGGGARGGGLARPPNPDAARLCHLLADSIGQRGSKRPNVTKAWIRDMDRLIRLDQRTPGQIEWAIDWLAEATDDVAAFWQPNIRSPGKLRTRWDQMREQYRRTTDKVVALQRPRAHATIAQVINEMTP